MRVCSRVSSSSTTRSKLTRREVLEVLAALGLAPMLGCAEEDDDRGIRRPGWLDPPDDTAPIVPDVDADRTVRALLDVILPAERDEGGALRSPGALEVSALEVLAIRDFVPTARALGLVRDVGLAASLPIEPASEAFDEALRTLLARELDARAASHTGGLLFVEASPAERERIVAEGFDDPALRPLLLLVRAACFVAFLGAVRSDAGLVAIGFPPFEDFEDRLACSGYPRSIREGRRLDPAVDDLAAYQARGDLDDYTYARAPAPTESDDLSMVIDEHGDLY
jgi:hypothetical protein